MVPMLPCGDIDEMARFWTSLGLDVTYRQTRPNPYLALGRGGIDLHYYGMGDVEPGASHSTCSILVPEDRSPVRAVPRRSALPVRPRAGHRVRAHDPAAATTPA
jgi:catechol 2,3-dioxygenase-like lactoylglutathione lyase family enzyme